ncbi:cytochrome d ubiquinol oxidase subunit II [Mycobacterium tuberculosis]
MAFAILVRGLPVDANGHVALSIPDVLNAYTLLGGLADRRLFSLYGAVFIALKTSGRSATMPTDSPYGFCFLWRDWLRALDFDATGISAKTGRGWCWAVAGSAQAAATVLVWRRVSDGWAFMHVDSRGGCGGAAVRCAVPEPALNLNPQWSLTIHNASSTPYTLKIMTWVTAFSAPLTVAYQTWTYWVLPGNGFS